ncbi:MAG: EutN/CcmL family microcompartment protein [Caldicoprobacterales bacterium]|jgi:ethanolamine utilization protein EutN|nr:EutN/CcmL family microcompartment protein [Clostridiales bacterium]
MILARVIGNVVATQKNPHLSGKKLMLIQPIDLKGNPAGSELLAVDAVGSGIGDLVIAIAEGRSARQVIKAEDPNTPVDTVIAGVVDEVITTQGSLYLFDTMQGR